MNEKRALVLDIGGIFFRPAWRLDAARHLGSITGVSEASIRSALDKQKTLFYTGSISETAYWDSVIEESEITSLSKENLSSIYRSFVQPISETLRLLPELSSRYTLIACNNSPREWMDYRKDTFFLDRYFDIYLTSGYVGVMKPERAMYDQIFGQEAAQALNVFTYIDDDEKNVSIVREQYGISTVLYKKPEDLLSRIS